MNKKQAGIIVALLALIVCAGVLAARVNGSLNGMIGEGYIYDDTLPVVVTGDEKGEEAKTTQTDEKTAETSSTSNTTSTNYFAIAKIEKETSAARTLANLKTIIDDVNVSQAEKDNAASKYSEITIAQDNEVKIELALKSKDFEDVVCIIEGDKARIIVKASEVSDTQRQKVQDVVMSVAKIKNIEIEVKK